MTAFRKYLLLSFTFAILNAVLLLAFFVPRFDHTDTAEYTASIEYISGQGGEVFQHRILKPLPILIGAGLAPLFGAKNTLIFQNLIFYFLSVWLIFLLIYRIYNNTKQAFYGTILYGTAYPMLTFGLAPLTDMPGWFFYLLSVLIALNLLKEAKWSSAFWAGLAAGFGMLFKESLGAAPIFFASLVFLATHFSFKDKIKYILVFGAAFALPVLANTIVIYQLYSYSYWRWFAENWSHSGQTLFTYTKLRILIEIGRVLAFGWLFVILGLVKEYFEKNKERVKILLSFVPPSLSFFLWTWPHNRIMYIAAPLLMFLASFGLMRNFKNPRVNTLAEISLLFLYILVNYAALEFFLRYGPIIQPRHTLFG